MLITGFTVLFLWFATNKGAIYDLAEEEFQDRYIPYQKVLVQSKASGSIQRLAILHEGCCGEVECVGWVFRGVQ